MPTELFRSAFFGCLGLAKFNVLHSNGPQLYCTDTLHVAAPNVDNRLASAFRTSCVTHKETHLFAAICNSVHQKCNSEILTELSPSLDLTPERKSEVFLPCF